MAKSSAIKIFIDCETHHPIRPTDQKLKQWVRCILKSYRQSATLSIRLVNPEESAKLNQQYRQKTGATNILSFNFEAPLGIENNILGDIVLCPALIAQEVSTKSFSEYELEAHWAHLTIHGCLHLLGYHHYDDKALCEMEQLEIEHLAKLGYPNPYK